MADNISQKTSTVLFISYDGLLDPLGGSQILPYLFGIARNGRALHVIKFEKPDCVEKQYNSLHTQLRDA